MITIDSVSDLLSRFVMWRMEHGIWPAPGAVSDDSMYKFVDYYQEHDSTIRYDEYEMYSKVHIVLELYANGRLKVKAKYQNEHNKHEEYKTNVGRRQHGGEKVSG